jgi:hypothetical protein
MKRSIQAISFGFLFAVAACNEHEVRPPEAPLQSAPTEQEELAALEASDRQELVTPAPEFWRPESPEPRLKLTLTAEDMTLHTGEKFRYRLEIQNVGAKDYDLYEKNSFIKIGARTDSRSYKVVVTFPDGSNGAILPPMLQYDTLQPEPDVDMSHMTKLEADTALREHVARQRVRNDLFLSLHPGETLSTRPDSPPPNKFRTLITAYPFKQPGRYRIKIVYDTRADDEGVVAESNTIEFQVIP